MKRKKNILTSEFWGTSLGFWFTFSVFFAVVGVAFFVGYEIFVQESGESVGKYVSPLADSFTVVLGLPIAFAGSVVAIILAQRSLTISKRQEHYESVSFVDGYVDDIYGRYSLAANSLREYMSDVADVAAFYFESSSEGVELDCNEPGLEEAKNNLLLSRKELKNSISSCSHNRIISQVWDANQSKKYSLMDKLSSFKDGLVKHDYNDNIEQLTDSYVSSTIQDRLYTLDSIKSMNDFLSILKFYYEVESEEAFTGDKFDQDPSFYAGDFDSLLHPWDHILVAGLFLCNKQSFEEVETDEIEHFTGMPFVEKELAYNLNYGAALICDFLRFRPSSEQIKIFLKQRLSEITHVDEYLELYVDRLVDNKNFDDMFPKKLCFSAEYIAKNDNLLYASEHCYGTSQNQVFNWYLHDVLDM